MIARAPECAADQIGAFAAEITLAGKEPRREVRNNLATLLHFSGNRR
jgi:hypothetical protein